MRKPGRGSSRRADESRPPENLGGGGGRPQTARASIWMRRRRWPDRVEAGGGCGRVNAACGGADEVMVGEGRARGGGERGGGGGRRRTAGSRRSRGGLVGVGKEKGIGKETIGREIDAHRTVFHLTVAHLP